MPGSGESSRWAKWAVELDEYLHRLDALLSPDLIIIGGGISKEAERFLPRLTVRPPVVPAQLQNEAGIVGAAMMATGWTSLPGDDGTEETPSQA